MEFNLKDERLTEYDIITVINFAYEIPSLKSATIESTQDQFSLFRAKYIQSSTKNHSYC